MRIDRNYAATLLGVAAALALAAATPHAQPAAAEQLRALFSEDL
jgi:hypothetical protein